MVQQALDRFGRIDTLVNNVGGASFKLPLAEIQAEGWRKTLELNLTSAFLTSRAVIAHVAGRHPTSRAEHRHRWIERVLPRQARALGVRVQQARPGRPHQDPGARAGAFGRTREHGRPAPRGDGADESTAADRVPRRVPASDPPRSLGRTGRGGSGREVPRQRRSVVPDGYVPY